MTALLRDLGSAFPGVELASLAVDLAHELRDPADVWRDHGITRRADARAVMATPIFRELYRQARLDWEKPQNTRERVRHKALMSLEGLLLNMHADVLDRKQPLNHRVQAAQFISRLAGVDSEAGGGGAAGGVSVHISLGQADRAESDIYVRRGGETLEGQAQVVEMPEEPAPAEAADAEADEDDGLLLTGEEVAAILDADEVPDGDDG